MMGMDSVEYHEHTVAGRGDDPVIAAAAYYASRGETPMLWGGRGSGLLGLAGEVDLARVPGHLRRRAAPTTPKRGHGWSAARRPGPGAGGFAAQECGRAGGDRPGRAHARDLDAERDATLAYLDRSGGRAGRTAGPSPGGRRRRAG